MAIRNFTVIVQAFKDFIRGKNATAELSEGTYTKDVVIDAPAKEFDKFYTRADQVSNEQSIATASEVGLEIIALNFSKVRKGARRSVTIVNFFRTPAPTSDITISAGTTVSTPLSDASNGIQFQTVQTVTMNAALALSYFNTNTGKYGISVEVQAVNAGVSGNVGVNTITTVKDGISGIEGVYNPFSASGGLDQETTTQLQTRLADSLASISVGTLAGFKSFVLGQDAVEDVLVVGQGATGRTEIGSVDIYVKGKEYRNNQDEFFDAFGPYPDFVFTKQPVIPDSLSSILSSGGGILPTGTGVLVKDTGAYGGSTLAQDKLHWTASVPATSGSIIVSYQYNGLVEDLQSLIQTENQNVVNSQTLVKWATEVPINVTVSVRILVGFTGSDVVSLVTEAISTFLNGFSIGQEVQQSDIIREILNTPGVDDALVPLTVFQSEDGSIIMNAFQNLTIPQTAYASAGNVVINLF